MTTAPVRLLESVSISQCVGRAVASANARKQRGERARRREAEQRRGDVEAQHAQARPSSAKKATAPMAPAAMPFAEAPESFEVARERRHQREREQP